MNWLEKTLITVRHSRALKQADWLWDGLRPLYDHTVSVAARSGLERVINGSDRLLISPRARGTPETYEPPVWASLMGEIRRGDRFVDVGAYIGLYAVAGAKRVGPTGKVWAFEPDHMNYSLCKSHLALNEVSEHALAINAAVGLSSGTISFTEGRGSESRAALANELGARDVRCVSLDDVFQRERIDILKIDVEGYEEIVLRGGENLLHDKHRSPRAIYIEMHPYAWLTLGTTSDSLLSLLRRFGYDTSTLAGQTVTSIDCYGEVVARKQT